ncbi:MAG: hypothetical protein S4CHLAM2_02740 [Chlamydiales bacterium]|nr:hypothetical protein [Chlamydiales bacterium]
MSYIETLAPRGYDPYTLLTYPYKEGVRNLSICCNEPTLAGRVKHCVVGLLLLVPLINTVVFVILRATTTVPVFRDEVQQTADDTNTLDKLTELRATLINERDTTPEGVDRIERTKAIATIEQVATRQMTLRHVRAVDNHLEHSARGHVTGDGQIYRARYTRAIVQQEDLPETGFTQVAGLHQEQGGNHLCGYYALFFMFQAITGERAFADRIGCHTKLQQWTTMIAQKRAAAWLYNRRNLPIPASLEVSVRGLSPYDIQYLIENDPELESLRATNDCFVMEMDSRSLTPLGSKVDTDRFPTYLILKEDMHYYFVWAEAPWEFKVVHSLGYSIHNSSYFREEVFFQIVERLYFQQPLELSL